jgi:hypothetical protein
MHYLNLKSFKLEILLNKTKLFSDIMYLKKFQDVTIKVTYELKNQIEI